MKDRVFRIRKGLDIKLKGTAEKIFTRIGVKGDYTLYPSDFPNLVPHLLVKEGDVVRAGTPIFSDKKDERIRFASPVSGEVLAIERGERRRIERIVVRCSTEKLEFEDFGTKIAASATRDELVKLLLDGGVWGFIRQRPFNVIASPDVVPRDIFISAFDTAPLAPDLDFAIKDDGASFQAGVDVLSRLTSGKVHIGVNMNYPANQAYTAARAEVHKFTGPHPAGNVGVQLHHVAPVAKGEVVWTLNPLDVVFIGRLVTTGHYDVRRIVAVAGSEVKKPRYYTAMVGTALQALLQDQLEKDAHVRIISGNVLTGTRETLDGALHFYDTVVTVIPEGDHHEFAGWAMPGFKKFSASRLFPAFLLPNREYTLDTNLHGGERAFVVSGQYERVFPMRIYPVNLLKAIMAKNIEQMEDLGIYEVAEEDFALCEVVCTSKIDSQRLVREGMDLMLREL